MDFTPEQLENLYKLLDERYAPREELPRKAPKVGESPKKYGRYALKDYTASTTENLDDLSDYLLVPFAKKDEAKELGAKFDGDKRLWYVPCSFAESKECFKKWRSYKKQEDGTYVYVDPNLPGQDKKIDLACASWN